MHRQSTSCTHFLRKNILMSNGLSAQDIESILKVVKTHDEVDVAVLYGSRALGTFQKGSDVDIALKGDELTSRICSHIHFELEEETLLPYFFDITNYETINNPKLKDHIDRIGQELYRKVGIINDE